MPFYPGGGGGGGGSVSEVASGFGLTGGPITTTGTLAAQVGVLTSSGDFSATTAAAGTTEQTLKSYTLPAGRLAFEGSRLLIKAHGVFIGSTRSKTVRLYWGNQTFTPNIPVTLAAQVQWRYEAEIIRLSSGNQRFKVAYWISDTVFLPILAPSQLYSALAGEDDAGPLLIKITGQVGGTPVDNDIQSQSLSVDLLG